MPRFSQREILIKEIDNLLKFMVMTDKDDTEDFEEIIDIRVSLEFVRYIDLRKYETKKLSLNHLLLSYTDDAFKQIVRMDKKSFLRILRLIAPNPVFHKLMYNRFKQYYAKQTPIWIQLMVVLIRLGCNGNGVSLGAVRRNCG